MTRITDAHFRDPSERHGDGHPLATTPEPVQAPPSPWMKDTLWIAEPSAAPVEYLAPLRELGFTQLCVRTVHGNTDLEENEAACDHYRNHGWKVVEWGRVDQQYGKDVRTDPTLAGDAAWNVVGPFAANVEIRWDEADNKRFAEISDIQEQDALCTYPGGMPDSAHRYYQQAGVRCILVQTFGKVGDYDHPYTIPMQRAYDWGKRLGYEIVIPQVGVFEYEPTKQYEDAARQARDLGPLPRHCYLTEQSGWKHISGQGYDFDALMRK